MSTKCRVIIVGGGLAGLTLANALQLAGIDFVLVEQRSLLDPQIGASIGLLPNASRIIDQIGCFDDIRQLTVPIKTQANHRADGSIIGKVTDTLELLAQRTGYDIVFIERRLVLRVLANHVDPKNIRLNSRISRIDQDQDGVVARLEDGTSLSGDIIVGADGIHSKVRSEMWRHAESVGRSNKFIRDRSAISAEYKCLFGISNNIPGTKIGETYKTFTKDLSTMTYVCKGGQVFWFLFIRMDKVHHGEDIPRFTQEDAIKTIQSAGHIAITENATVTIRDLHRTSQSCVLVPVEEAAFEHWTQDRIVCIGDSVHKVTPNLGAGGSCAIETAACLANTIHALTLATSKPGHADILIQLERFRNDRRDRVNRVMAVANYLTRLQALRTRKEYIKSLILGPLMEDKLGETFSDFLIAAPAIAYLPYPPRSFSGTMPFNPQQGWGFEESRKTRAKAAAPLLIISAISVALSLSSGASGFSFWHKLWIDQKQSPATHKNEGPSLQSLNATINFCVLYTIWLLESNRGCHKLTLVQTPLLFIVAAQKFNLALIAPLYFLILYAESQVSKFKAQDNRMTDIGYSRTALPAVLCFIGVPALFHSHLCPLNIGKSSEWLLCGSWTYSAPLISVSQFMFANFVMPSTSRQDRLWNVRRDLSVVRVTTVLVSVTSASMWLYVDRRSETTSSPLNLVVYHADTCLALMSGLGFLLFSASDLKNAGMLDASWTSIIAKLAISICCAGPAATFTMGWMWREEILAFQRHKGAITSDHRLDK